ILRATLKWRGKCGLTIHSSRRRFAARHSGARLPRMDRTVPASTSSKEAPVELAPYDSRWPAQFEIERAVLEVALEPWLTGSIEHVGSTAVSGLTAKPIIDIMAPVASLSASRAAIEAAANVGYLYYPYKPDVMH